MYLVAPIIKKILIKEQSSWDQLTCYVSSLQHLLMICDAEGILPLPDVSMFQRNIFVAGNKIR